MIKRQSRRKINMLKDLNQLIDYIEEHLTEGLSYKIIAENTGISEYQLKRIFTFIAGMSLMDYIKNRRLALANRDLLDGSR
ncbi:GyrI-like domain-containing protein, partial [Enterococcus faecium]